MGFLPGEGLPYGIISLGKSCYGISSGGRFAIIMVFLQGERLSYGIISAGTISHLFPYHEICVGGDLP